MGEYYNWVNMDKRKELFSKEWAGDYVFFMGDETVIPACTDNDALNVFYKHILEAGYTGNVYDVVVKTYRNISGLFSHAESNVRREILFYLEDIENGITDLSNEYGVDVSRPFEGLFLRNGRDFLFTINHSKRVYYSLEKTKVYSLKNHEECDQVDPLPLLMCYGRVTDPGVWLGDIIGVADEPPVGYELLEEIVVDW